MKLQNKIKRIRGDGLEVEEVGSELPRSKATFAQPPGAVFPQPLMLTRAV